MYDVSVIIPTFNEEEAIQKTVLAIDAVLLRNNIDGEILIVDDNSSDGTIKVIKDLEEYLSHLHHVIRIKNPGLSQSVVDGFDIAHSDTLLVMDADYSHPPGFIPEMIDEIRAGADIVIGSRYMKGGDIEGWPALRKAISRGATILGRLLFPEITDPVSGFFAVRRSVIKDAPLKPKGYKILLEILGRGTYQRVKEIPYIFTERKDGRSKLKIRTIVEYARQVSDLFITGSPLIKFGIVGMSGILVNTAVLFYLTEINHLYYVLSSFFAIEIAILNNFFWNDSWTFTVHTRPMADRIALFHLVSVGGVAINIGLLYLLTQWFGIYYLISNLIAIIVAFLWNFTVNKKITWN